MRQFYTNNPLNPFFSRLKNESTLSFLQMHYIWKPFFLYFGDEDQRVEELRKTGTGTQKKKPYNTAQCYWKFSIFLIIF